MCTYICIYTHIYNIYTKCILYIQCVYNIYTICIHFVYICIYTFIHWRIQLREWKKTGSSMKVQSVRRCDELSLHTQDKKQDIFTEKREHLATIQKGGFEWPSDQQCCMVFISTENILGHSDESSSPFPGTKSHCREKRKRVPTWQEERLPVWHGRLWASLACWLWSHFWGSKYIHAHTHMCSPHEQLLK